MWVMSKRRLVDFIPFSNLTIRIFCHAGKEKRASSVQPQQSQRKEASSNPLNSPGSKYKSLSLCRLDLNYGAHTHWYDTRWLFFFYCIGLDSRHLECEQNEVQGQEDKELQGVSEKEFCYSKLPEEDKDKIRTILFMMDRFSISHEAYHEMSQVPGLQNVPRSYLIQGCQASCNRLWQNKLKKTPGPWPGAEIPMNDLLESEIRRHVSAWNKFYFLYLLACIVYCLY